MSAFDPLQTLASSSGTLDARRASWRLHVRHMAALAFFGLALSGCSDSASQEAYEQCVANSRAAFGRSAEAFCDCLRDDSNLDMSAAHPAEECVEKAGLANPAPK